MSFEELIQELRKLNRVEKLRAMQVLVNALTVEEELLVSDQAYEIFTPYGNEASAQVLYDFLQADAKSE